MPNDNITPFNRNQSHKNSNSITLESIQKSITAWRSSRKKRNEKIPSAIWDDIFILLKTESKTRIIKSLSIGWDVFSKEQKRRNLEQGSHFNPSIISDEMEAYEEELVLCEANLPSYPLDSKPAKAFDTSTSVVELYRPDGMLIKIHICTDRFEELLNAFFKGQS